MLFKRDRGIIPALDYADRAALVSAIEETKNIPSIVGYKLGVLPVMQMGLSRATQVVRQHTDLPIIYDQQKLFYACNDDFEFTIPSIVAKSLQASKIEAGIILGLGNNGIYRWYKEHLKAFIEAFLEHSIIPVVVSHMTTPAYLAREGGYVPDDVPEVSFRLAAGMGVEYFVVPGNKPKDASRYVEMLSGSTNPNFLAPGFGSQKGDEEELLGVTKGKPTYLIAGPADGIDVREYCKSLEVMLML